MNESNKVLVVITHGLGHEKSSAAFGVVGGGLNEGMDMTVFLASDGVDLVRKGALNNANGVHAHGALKEMMANFLAKSGKIYACTPCVNSRGYTADDLIPEATIAGASIMYDLIKEGAVVLSF